MRDLTSGDRLGLPICAVTAARMNGTVRLDEGMSTEHASSWSCTLVRPVTTLQHFTEKQVISDIYGKEFQTHTHHHGAPYANGPVHIGHLAGVYVPADIYARYLRLKGREVVMVGGSDEHGVPITIKAGAKRA